MDYGTLEQVARREGAARLLPGVAVAVLEDVISGRRPLRAVYHPLGFSCLPVLREGERGICIHVFDNDAVTAVPPDWTRYQVHSHSWELTSFILYGQLSNLRARVHDDPDRATHRVFEIHSSPSGEDEIRPTPRLVRCELEPDRTSDRGETYGLPAGEFHTTVVPGDGTAATFVLGRSCPGATDLSLGPVHATGRRVVRRMCDAAGTTRIAASVVRRIHALRARA